MRLGQRSTRIRHGPGRQLSLGRQLSSAVARPRLARLAVWLPILAIVLATTAYARTTSVGPGRIVCNASFCEMGTSARPQERVRVIVSDLPREEIARLRKCTGVSKPCIVEVDGEEQGGPMKIMAISIRWSE